MANKPKFLKNLLTTASAITLVAVSANSAMATGANTPKARQIVATPADANTGANLDKAPGGQDLPVAPGSIVQSTVDNAVYNAGGINLKGFDVNSKTGNVLNTNTNNSSSVSIGSVTGGSTNPQKMNVNVTEDELIFTGEAIAANANGNDYSGIGDIFMNKASGIQFNFLQANQANQAVFSGKIRNAQGNGAINANKYANIHLAKGFEGIMTFEVANGGRVQIGGNSTFVSTAAQPANIELGGELAIDAGAKLTGINGGSSASIIGSPTQQGGKIGDLTLLGDSLGDKVTLINVADGITDLNNINIGNVIFQLGDNTKTVNTQNIKFNSAEAVGGPNANKAELALGAAAPAAGSNFGSVITVAGAISTADGSGIISLNGNNASIRVGKIGDSANAATMIPEIRFNSDNLLRIATGDSGAGIVNNSDFGVIKVTTATANTGSLSLGLANELDLTGDIGEDGKSLKNLFIHSNDGLGSGATTVNLKDGKAIYAKDVYIVSTSAGPNNTLSLGEGSKVVGNIETNNAGHGKISVKGSSQIIGNVSSDIDSIKFDAEGKTLAFTGSELGTTNGVDFTANGGTLVFTPDDANTDVVYRSKTLIGNGKIAVFDASAVGAGKKFTVTKQIGTAQVVNGQVLANALTLLKGPVNGTLSLGQNSFINNIDMSGGDGVVQLTGSNDYQNPVAYGIDKIIHDNEKLTLLINGISRVSKSVDVFAPIELSSETNLLNAVEFKGNDSTLILFPPVQIFTKNGIKTDTPGEGILEFRGSNNVIGGDVGTSAAKLLGIDLTDNVSLEIKNNAYFAEKINIGRNAVLTLSGSTVEAEYITSRNDNSGTVIFDNAAAFEYKGDINENSSLAEIQFNGADVKISGFISDGDNTIVTKFNFTSDTPMNLDITESGDDVLRGREIKVASTKFNQSITVAGNQTIDSNIGTKENKIDVILSNDRIVTIDTKDAHIGLKTASANVDNPRGKIVVNANGTTIYGIGEDGKLFDVANFDADTTVSGAAFVRKVRLADGVTLKLERIYGESISIKGNTAGTIEFADDARLKSHIKTSTAGVGNVTVIGNMSITEDIGTANNYVRSVEFLGDKGKEVNSSANIYANNTKFGALNFVSRAPKNIGDTAPRSIGDIASGNGTVTSNGTTFKLLESLNINSGAFTDTSFIIKEDKKLTLTGNSVAAGKLVISGTAGKGGNIVLEDATFDASVVTAAEINIAADPTNKPAEGSTKYLIDATGANNDYNPFNLQVKPQVIGYNFLKATVLSHDTKGLLIQFNDDRNGYVERILKGARRNTILAAMGFIDPNNTGDAAKYSDALAAASDEDFKKSVEQMSNVTIVAANEVNKQIMLNANNVVGARLNSVNGAMIRVAPTAAASAVDGVAAGGDESLRYGAWVSPFYNQSIQKARKGLSGYKVINGGGSFGFDTLANDDTTVGLAMTISKAEIKHRDVLAGDKTNIGSLMVSVYGTQNFADNWFVQGIASFGSSRVKTKEKRNLNDETAIGKYDSMTYSGELTAGYNYKIADTGVLVPMAGMRYSRFSDTGYTETGTAFQNRTIAKKSTDKIDLIAGFRAEMFATNYHGVDFAPEVHGFINHDLKGRSAKVNMSLSGSRNPISYENIRPIRTFYNVGLGLNAKSGRFEYGAGYDAQIANKYLGHTGSLKFRVCF